MDKSDNTTQIKPLKETSVDTSAEHVRELEDELLKLRIENAFLKELRRLRLARTKQDENSSDYQQSPKTIQTKRSSLIYRNAKGNIYVLAKTF